MDNITFWNKQGMHLASFFFTSFFVSMAMLAVAPHWPPIGVVVLGASTLAVLANLIILVWSEGHPSKMIQLRATRVTSWLLGIGFALAGLWLLISLTLHDSGTTAMKILVALACFIVADHLIRATT